MKYIIVIKTSDEIEVKKYEKNQKITLNEWQSLFGGGNVECVPSIFPGIEIIIDEEGKHKGLPVNAIATGLLHPSIADVLAGDAVLAAVKKDSLDGMSEYAKEFIVQQISAAVTEAKAEVTEE